MSERNIFLYHFHSLIGYRPPKKAPFLRRPPKKLWFPPKANKEEEIASGERRTERKKTKAPKASSRLNSTAETGKGQTGEDPKAHKGCGGRLRGGGTHERLWCLKLRGKGAIWYVEQGTVGEKKVHCALEAEAKRGNAGTESLGKF